ncbi:hypothetical protein [Streptomyces cinereoruber]|uniref:hypothetical protein n=1 Tax=Streptomyces cinereoruber TaxID=67260 RepID=UPI0036858171
MSRTITLPRGAAPPIKTEAWRSRATSSARWDDLDWLKIAVTKVDAHTSRVYLSGAD